MLVNPQQAEKNLLPSPLQFLDEQALDTQRVLQLFLSSRANEDTGELMYLDKEDPVISPNYSVDIQQTINEGRLHIQLPDKPSGSQRRARLESVSAFLNFPIAVMESAAAQLTAVTILDTLVTTDLSACLEGRFPPRTVGLWELL